MSICSSKYAFYKSISPLKWLIIEVKALLWASAGMTEEWDYRSSCSPAGVLIHGAPAHPRAVPGTSCDNSQSSPPPPPYSQCTCTNPCTTNLQFSFLNSELPKGDLRCQGHPQHTGWAEHKLPWNRQREINFWGWKDLKHHLSRNLREISNPPSARFPKLLPTNWGPTQAWT